MLTKIHIMLERIRQTKPLILNITNDVTTEFIANGLLSLGALPVMSRAYQEADELVKLASAVVINPGTLDEAFIKLSTTVCDAARRHKKPVILDPVGVGASAYRTQHSQHLLENYPLAIIRGNASEIMALSGALVRTNGVENTALLDDALESAQSIAKKHGVTVVMSGAVDAILDKNCVEQFARGTELMTKMTGAGCLLTAVVGAFHAVHESAFEAAAAAALFYSLCGEMAEKHSRLPGSFKTHFIDALSLQPMFYPD